MINKISDIQIGKEYVILLIQDIKFARKCIVRAIINEQKEFKSDKTEISVDLFKDGKWSSTNLLHLSEIGIGIDAEEAFKNFGRFNYEEHIVFDSSIDNANRKSELN
ncbi:MAG: hypothetical protein AAFX78_18885 [Cyanobacteria bacterium J06638_20]